MKVSVIMTFFNETPDVLKRSVYSILNQTYQDFEFIIMAGNPENVAAIELLKDISAKNNKVNFLVGESKLLMTVCLNRMIKLAKGKYIALQESDDESLPERLDKELAVIEKNADYDIVGAAIEYVNDADQTVLVQRFYPEHPRKAFNKYTAFAHPTYLAKKDLFEKYGYYNESEEVRHSPDFELWCRWLVQGVRFYNIPEILFKYYQSANNGRNKNAKKTLESVIKLKTKYGPAMQYTWQDHLFLTAEKILMLVPQPLISKLFYVWVKLKKA